MNIVKSASLPVPYAAEQSPRTISAWLEFFHSSIGGLMRLGKAISRGFVPGTDWDDSILSFRLGFHGSAIKDSEDQTENAFTIYCRGHQREIDPEWLLFEIRAKL